VPKDKDYRIVTESTGKRQKYRDMTIEEAIEKDETDNEVNDLFFYQMEHEAIGMSFSPNPANFLQEKVDSLRNGGKFDGFYIDAGIIMDAKLKISKNETQYYVIKMNSITTSETIDLFVWEKSFASIGKTKLNNLKKFNKVLIVGHENSWRVGTYNLDELIVVE